MKLSDDDIKNLQDTIEGLLDLVKDKENEVKRYKDAGRAGLAVSTKKYVDMYKSQGKTLLKILKNVVSEEDFKSFVKSMR